MKPVLKYSESGAARSITSPSARIATELLAEAYLIDGSDLARETKTRELAR